MRKSRDRTKILRGFTVQSAKMLTVHKRSTYPSAMDQTQLGGETRSGGGGAVPKASRAKDRRDKALSRREAVIEERPRAEHAPGEESPHGPPRTKKNRGDV